MTGARTGGTQRAYSRVYHGIVDDPKFAEIYDNDHHLATWLRFLLRADQAWPASADIPAAAARASVKKLAEVGLLELLSTGRYKVRGLDAERERRAESNGGLVRAATGERGPDGRYLRSSAGRPLDPHGGPAGGPQGVSHRRQLDETRRDEQSRDETRRDEQSKASTPARAEACTRCGGPFADPLERATDGTHADGCPE